MTHPAVRDLFQTLSRHLAFQEVLAKALRHEDSELALAGLTPTAKALYLVLLWQLTERTLLVVTDGNQSAETLLELTETFFDLLIGRPEAGSPQLLPALDVLPGQNLSPHTEIREQRAIGLWRMAAAKAPITIAPVGSALLRTHTGDYYRRLAVELRIGEELPLETIEAHLISIGYEKREPVEMTGEYSIRGGILDVFPAENARPLRIEFFDDEIESIRRFDVESQRSVMKLTEVEVLPLAEQPRIGATYPGWEFAAALQDRREQSLLDLEARALVVLDEPEQIRGAAERLWKRLDQQTEQQEDAVELAAASFFHLEELEVRLAARRLVAFRELDLNPETPHIATRPTMAFHGSMQVAVAETKTMVEQGYRVALFAPSNGELERLADILREYSVPFQLGLAPNEAASPYLAERAYLAGPVAHTYLIKGLVRRGAIFPDSSIAFIGAEDLFDPSDLIARPGITKSQLSVFAADLADLKPGDFVVHTTHGVGKFLGLREIVQGEQKGDFMLLEYAGESKLYVPLTRMDLVEKYRGGGESGPPLDRLGGATWTQRKTKVKAKMRDMADELLKLYAQRRVAEGYSFSKDSNWQREFEDAFEFTETKDQTSAAKEIKRDMESPHPMDRLLCGDVGFGKTEIAMRAAFKALGDGKQVAVLAPTTVLAFQHFESFKRRFAAFPVRIAMFSRFISKKELAQSVEELAAGKIDIAIGTHRLLSEDIEFRDLGLLIFDEEQRFGVRHKERLKQMRQNVDVLTMSATPIPRTLHMSMLGIRDMSVIETPPKDRLAIQTVVAHFDNGLIRTAIEQEISRGGQVYFVHNRVDSIYTRAAAIQDLVPNARIGVGHGQMGEEELERVLLGFMRHEYDVFVCTTIVENGLDIPLANTIIIENAERYGLSEMYQLRGRVGRSNRRAYAYLLVPGDTELSEVARKRLAALREFSDLGAGFKIAALDLELRGAGNLLGGEQHGHIAAVGFDMYLKMLDETVQELKGEETPLEVHSALNLGLDIRIPPEYISDEHQRLRAYKRIADAKTTEQAATFRAELEDRYGPPPEAVGTLFAFALLKTEAEKRGVEAIDRRGSAVQIKFHPGSKIDPARLMALVSSVDGAQFTPAGVLRLPLDTSADTPGGVLAFLEKSLETLGDGPAAKPAAEQGGERTVGYNCVMRNQLLLAGIAAAGMACAAEITVIDEIIAKVNGDIVTRGDYERTRRQLEASLRQQGAKGESLDEAMKEGEKNILRERIDQLLLQSRAKELNLNVDSEVAKQLAEIQRNAKISDPEKFQEFVREQTGMSYEDYKNDRKNDLLTNRVIRQEVAGKIQITREEAQQYYDGHKDEFQREERVFLREILVAIQSGANAAEAEKKAKDLSARGKKGEKFDELARNNSDAVSAQQAGEIGAFEKGNLRPEIEKTIWDQARGYVTDPINVGNGFLILKVEEHQKAGLASFEEVQQEINNRLLNPRFGPELRRYLTQLRLNAFLEIKPGFEDTGAAPGKNTAWVDPAEIKPETVTKEVLQGQTHRRHLLGFIPIPGTNTVNTGTSASR